MDPIVIEIQKFNCVFLDSKEPEPPTVVDGIQFWRVGWNASHEFYAGTKDGKRYRMALGEGDFDDLDAIPEGLSVEELRQKMDECMLTIHRRNIDEVPNWSGYWGHH